MHRKEAADKPTDEPHLMRTPFWTTSTQRTPFNIASTASSVAYVQTSAISSGGAVTPAANLDDWSVFRRKLVSNLRPFRSAIVEGARRNAA